MAYLSFPSSATIILKLDVSGNLVWNNYIGGSGDDWLTDIHRTADDNYFLTGKSNSNDGDVSGNNGGMDIWVVKLNGIGEIVWNTNLGGSLTDEGNCIQQMAEGEFIILGSTISNDGDVTDHYGSNTWDIWAVKLNANLGISTFAESEKIKVYPNPVKTTFVIETLGNENVEFVFRDIGARQIHIPRTTIKNSFNATSLPSGIYFATVKSAGSYETVKVLKVE